MFKREFIRSGIPGLDEILGGGMLKNTIYTLSGPTGSGKSTFGMQFLVSGATQEKQPGLYISIEETKESTYFHMSGYKWDLDKLERNKQLVFLDYPIYEVDQFLAQNSAIAEIINTLGIERVVIDSIMPVALLFNGEDERKRGFLKLIDNIRKWKTTTLILSEDVPATTQDVLPDTRYGIESFTDGWLHLYFLYERARERKRAIEVLKAKGVSHSTKIYPIDLNEAGFTVQSK
jgi:KaiC/GvpD/RAD55 family RecA-like ATPase